MFSRKCSFGSNPRPNEPNPYKFTIGRTKTIGEYCVVEAIYPDCNVFGGRKVMVFDSPLSPSNKLDPHFTEDSGSPIARFPGSPTGWIDAIAYTEMKAKP